MFRDSVTSVTLCSLYGHAFLLDRPESRRLQDHVRLRVVVVVHRRRRRHCLDSIPRREPERERCTSGPWPQVHDHPIRQYVVLAYSPPTLRHGPIERRPIDVVSGRQPDLGDEHAVPAIADALGRHGARDRLPDRRVEAVVFDRELERFFPLLGPIRLCGIAPGIDPRSVVARDHVGEHRLPIG